MKVASGNRHGHRDATMILLAFRHGLRASELCSLRWDQIDLTQAKLHVVRAKNGMPSVHPLTGTELRALRRLRREQEPGRYVFMSERGAPMSAVGFRRTITRLGKPRACRFRSTHTCCVTRPATNSRTRASIHAPSSTTSATKTSSTPYATRAFAERFRDFWKD